LPLFLLTIKLSVTRHKPRPSAAGRQAMTITNA
jgi:hypothetical protein